MTRRLSTVLLVLGLVVGVAAGPGAAQPASQGVPLALTPSCPQPGQPVTVTYDPQAEGATLRSPGALELVVRSRRPDSRFLPMEKAEGRWQARFTPRPDARFLRLYVQSDSLADRNGGGKEGAGWGHMLCGPDGKPVRGAHLARAAFLRDKHGDAPRASLRAAYRREQALYPDHPVAAARLRLLQAEVADEATRADSLRQVARDEVDAARQQHAEDAEKLREVQRAYYVLGRRGMAQSVGATLMEVAPSGPEARLAAFRRATGGGQSPVRMRRRVEDFRARFPGSFFESSLYEALFQAYRTAALADSARVDSARLDSMRWAGRRWIQTEQVNVARAHGWLARALAEAGRYDAAARHARRALQAVREDTPADYSFFKAGEDWSWAPDPHTPAERRRQARRQRGEHRAVLGRIHVRRGRYAEAAATLTEAAGERPEDAALWMDLAKARQKASRPAAAFAAAEEAVRHAPTEASARALFRRLYAERRGSEQGASEAIARLARPGLLAVRLQQPAPPLRLTRLEDGNAAADSARRAFDPETLEGKVLVLDFWASWCAPCRQAFPHLQAAYEQYRDDPDVAFLAINTSWNETKARARRFIEREGYTFPTYWDAGGQLAQAFEVRGIPATIFIGKDGRVQYRESGFGSLEQYADNLALRIDLLRSL